MSNENLEPGPDDLAGLVVRLQETPQRLAAIADELSEPLASAGGPSAVTIPTEDPPAHAGGSDILRWRNSDDEFSVLEHLCHLRDIEAEGYALRIERILKESSPFLADIDGSRLAIERSYNDQDPKLALRAFTVARTKNVEKLIGLDSKELKREGNLEGVGQVTLERLICLMWEHDESHLEDLRVLCQKLARLRVPLPSA
jgi:hypothetical protein